MGEMTAVNNGTDGRQQDGIDIKNRQLSKAPQSEDMIQEVQGEGEESFKDNDDMNPLPVLQSPGIKTP